MDGQRYFDKKQSQKNQAYFLQEWETFVNSEQVTEGLEGKIVARLPDLGDNKMTEVLRQQQISSVTRTSITSRIVRVVQFPLQLVRSTFKTQETSLLYRKRKISFCVISCCLILALIGGGIWIHKHNKKKAKEIAKAVALQKETDKTADAVVKTPEKPAEKIVTATEKKVEMPAKVEPVKPAEKTETVAKAEPAKPVEKPAEKTETVAKAEPAKPAEKPANPTEKIPDKFMQPVVAPAAEKVANNKGGTDSPWERQATDNYSPWTMNSPERQLAVAAASVSENKVMLVTPSNQINIPTENINNSAAPAVAMVSMNPISPNPSAPVSPQIAVPPMYPQQPIQNYSMQNYPAGTVPQPNIPAYPNEMNGYSYNNNTQPVYNNMQPVYPPNINIAPQSANIVQNQYPPYPYQNGVAVNNYKTPIQSPPIPIQVLPQQQPPQATMPIPPGIPMTPQQSYYPQPNTVYQGNVPSPYRKLY